MNIAELFVKLGVKGDTDSGKKINKMNKGLADVRSKSIATKAAIVGVIFGFERLMSNSAKTGVQLNQFARSTGLSTKELQKWEEAGRKARVSQEEIRSGFVGVQTAISNMLRGGGAPKGYGMLTTLVEDFDENKITDTFYMMQKIQELAQKTDAATARDLVTSFGISQNMFGAMRENAFTAEKMQSAMTYSEGEINKLKRVEVAWSKIYKNMEMSMGRLTAKHGYKIAEAIAEITPKVTELVEKLILLADKWQVFQKVGDALAWVNKKVGSLGEVGDIVSGKKKGVSQKVESQLQTGYIKMLQRYVDQGKKLSPEAQKVYNNYMNIRVDGAQNPKAVAEEIKNKINTTYRSKVTSQEN